MSLMLTGRKKYDLVKIPQLDWELKAFGAPYDSLSELMQEYHLGALNGDSAAIEVLAHHVAEVDFSSPISGEIARPAVILAKGLSPNLVTLGYRVFVQGKVIRRESLTGAAMEWEVRDLAQHGSGLVNIPAGAVLHCVASYANVAQHQGFLADRMTVQNPQRSVFEAFDPGLSVLKDFMDRSGSRGTDARQLESSIAWLFSMLGFRVTHLGNIEQTTNAVDLIVATPLDSFALVECTTGMIKADKVDLLVSRVEMVRRRLKASGVVYPKVLAVMATTRPREEVKVGAEAAEKMGVLVLSRGDLNRAVDRTILFPNPEAIFAEAEQALRRNEKRHSKTHGNTFSEFDA